MKAITVLTAALLTAAAALPATAAPIIVKFSHVVAENTPKGKAARLFEKLAEDRLPGKVDVQIFPNSQLYGDNDELLALLKNDVQLVAPALSKFSKFTDVLQIYDLPFLFEDLAAVDCFQNKPEGQAMLQAMQKKSIVGLAYWHNGMKQLSAKRPLRAPADAAGRKFRIMSSDVLEAQFEALDANPQKLAFSEVYLALQTGTVDGQENTWSNTYSQKFHEVQPHITESNHGVLDYMVVTNQRFWNGLPADVREGLEQALAEATAAQNAFAQEENDKARAAIVASGRSQILQLTDAERRPWVEAMRPVWKKFESDVGAANIAAAQTCGAP